MYSSNALDVLVVDLGYHRTKISAVFDGVSLNGTS